MKALFFDIDGTLVSFRTHTIPDSTLQAVSRAKAAGVKVFISTGRPMVLIDNLHRLQDAGLIDGYITMNGAHCSVGGEPVSKRPLPPDEARVILRYTSARNIPCIVVGANDICVHRDGELLHGLFYRELQCSVRLREKTVDEAAPPGKELFQLTAFVTEEQERELAPLVPNCEMSRWHPAFVDICAKGCTKRKGMDDILGHFGIDLSDTMAFGDGGNDIPMLRHARIGVAMGNALPPVQAAADYVTDTVDNDGIRKALEHFRVI